MRNLAEQGDTVGWIQFRDVLDVFGLDDEGGEGFGVSVHSGVSAMYLVEL